MVSVTHNSMNGRGKIGEGLETNGQCPFFAQDSQSYRRRMIMAEIHFSNRKLTRG